MPKIKKNPPQENERVCGNCRHEGLILPDELHYPWSGPWVCKNDKVNPEKKDPKDGKGIYYDREACENWEW